jgi:hypothetical protein
VVWWRDVMTRRVRCCCRTRLRLWWATVATATASAIPARGPSSGPPCASHT